MHKSIAAWLFAVISLLGTPVTVAAQTAPSAGVVSQLQGTAAAQRNGANVPLSAQAAVYADDTLTTGPDSKLLVTFSDGTQLTLGPDADVVIDDFVYTPGTNAGNAALNVTSGAARVVAGALERIGGNQGLNVTTPVATIGIRGTDFFIEFEDNHLSVALFSGFEVAVTNAAGTTVLHPGEGTDIWGSTGTPTRPLVWNIDRVNRALALVSVTPELARPLPYARPVAMADSLGEALRGGMLKMDARYRYEHVDQASRPRTAYASTGRLRVGYETLAVGGFSAGIEGEITREIGNARRSDGVHNQAALPLIADPESEQVNQAYVSWTTAGSGGLALARVTAGRQRISYDNERWIGPGAFRQNDQTFDAVSLEARPMQHLALRYAYLDRINRILGDNPNGYWKSDSHLVSAITDEVPFGWTTLYAYALDLKPVPQFSSVTYGLRYDAPAVMDINPVGVEAEFAYQTDYAANPADYALTYALVRPSFNWNRTTLYAGWERLGGNGLAAVQTPLATLHRQNGWADMFTVTPANGLRDYHVRLFQEFPEVGPMKNVRVDLRYHDFASTRGGIDYGTEFDIDVNTSVLGYATVGVRYANYNAQRFESDTKKIWFYVEAQY